MAEQDLEGRDWREIARIVGVVVVVAVLTAFVVVNRHSVRVDFIFADREAPLFVVLFLAAVLGLLLGALVRRVRRR